VVVSNRPISTYKAITGKERPPVEVFTKVDRAGTARTWALIQDTTYPISGALADKLIEIGVAWHNPYAGCVGRW